MFTHLHLHTDFSLLDGVLQINPLIEKIKNSGMKACAITDHGNMYGAFKFHSYMKAAELKPIIGCEIYISPRSMFSKEFGTDNKYYHMVLLAKNLQGYKNLIKIVSKAHMEGYYYKPRVDFDVISAHSEGLIALSGCLSGVISKHLNNNEPKQARENLEKYATLFKDNFYIEIQRNGMEIQEKVNEQLLSLAKEYKLPIVATCDAHFLNKEDYELQEVLWGIRDGKTLDDPTRAKLDSQEFYVKTPEEMEAMFKDLPEAIENTQKIADQIEDFELKFGRIEPVFKDLPEGVTAGEMLRKLTFDNAPEKYGELTEELKNRLDYELKVIDDKGYNDYFLIVRAFIKFCRDNGIVVGIRGSACGSAIAYCVGITHVEPIGWELYFERFLNPERKSAPDIDIDIADERRDEVIQFAIDMFGEACVKQIGTFSKLQTRQAIRDIARVLGIDLTIADRLSKMVVIEFGKSKPIDYMIEHNKEFADIVNSTPELVRMTNIVRKLSGVHRGVSTHACGIIITPEPITEYCPIQRDAHGGGMGMTQYEMGDTEEVGLMKYDFLGLRNLSIIGKTVSMVERDRKVKVDLLKIPAHDNKAFKLIQAGHTVGVFQMEGEGMKKVVRSVKPETLEEISYVLAAYRPGPMQFIPEYVAVKDKKKEPEYLFPELIPILSITNGVITYQEQVIRIAVDIAGYTMGSADVLRKAMGKKKMDVMEKEKPIFIEGAVKKGFDKEAMEKLWEKLLQFANYGFNKAHSASYAYVTYWTAYLKANYPIEFMASILESDLENFNRVIIDMEECKRLGIQVLPPEVNKSNFFFKMEGDKNIRFGMGAIKNVGEEVVKAILEERDSNGEYLNLDDFLYRLANVKVNQKTIEYIIKAGIMDAWGSRESLIAALPNLFDKYKKEKEKESRGQFDMFMSSNGESTKNIKTATPLPAAEPFTAFQKLQWEKELLGLYMTSHPLAQFEDFFLEKKTVPIAEALKLKQGAVVILGGIITKIKRFTTKKNENMAFATLEDQTGTIDVVIFPRSYEVIKNELLPDVPILFAGRINIRDEEKTLIGEKGKALDPAKCASTFEGVTFRINELNTEEEIMSLKQAIRNNPGDLPVKVITYQDSARKVMILNNKIAVTDEIKVYIDRFS